MTTGGPTLAAAALALAGAAAAQDTSWSARKCALYRGAWEHAAQGAALEGVRPEFVSEHDAFLASGCSTGRVCPQTGAELALADLLSLMAVAEGMTGSFLPFGCGG